MSEPSDPEAPESQPEPAVRLGAMAYAGVRLALVFGLLLVLIFAIYRLPGLVRNAELGVATVSAGFMLVAPFCLGALVSLLADPEGKRSTIFHMLVLPSAVSGIVTLAGAVVLREGLLCIVMLIPVWFAALSLGGLMIHSFHTQFHDRGRMNAAILAGVAALASAIGPDLLSVSHDYRFERTIIVDAAPEEIWPHLESLTDIGPAEGRWTITQNLLAVPRPVSARLIGEVRYAEWEGGVRFEEHITKREPGRLMEWEFVFPDPSLQQHVDRHIDPDGRHLKVSRGGYLLEPLPDGRTRVPLHTAIRLDTQLNPYPAMWARLMLGDIQDNILEIIRTRAESA